MRRRVVVTGIGLVTPVGVGREESWSALLAGKSGVGPITQFDTTDFATKFAGEVKNFDPTRWIEKREAKSQDRFLHFALAAAQMAWNDSGVQLSDEERDRAGVYI